MENSEIKKSILNVLSGTSYELSHFERDLRNFGNMTAVVSKETAEYRFISDRDDIFCDGKLIYVHARHVAGEDDLPQYLIKAIEQVIR